MARSTASLNYFGILVTEGATGNSIQGSTALTNIKPTDALIVGMYQQFGDQAGENAGYVRELCARQS